MITTLIRNRRRPQERFAVTREPLADRLAMAPAGLVVDYIVAQNLKNALGQYSKPDRDQTGIDERQAVAVLREKYEVVRAMFAPDTRGGFDYWPALAPNASSQTRLSVMAGAIEWVLAFQQEAASKETSEEGKKRAHRRYGDAVLALSKAFDINGLVWLRGRATVFICYSWQRGYQRPDLEIVGWQSS